MKILKLIGVAIMAVILSVNLVACSDDEKDQSDNTASLVGQWKVEKFSDGEGIYDWSEWDDGYGGYPYFIITATHFYFTDNGSDKSDYCTYTYDEQTKIIKGRYVNSGDPFDMKVMKLTNAELQLLDEEEGVTFYMSRVK